MPRMLVMSWDVIYKSQHQKITVITSLYMFDLTTISDIKNTSGWIRSLHIGLNPVPIAFTSISQRIPGIWNRG